MCENVLSSLYDQRSSDRKEVGREGVVVEIVRMEGGKGAQEKVSTLVWSLPGRCLIST